MAANDNNNLEEHKKNNTRNNKCSNKETKPKTNMRAIGEQRQTAKIEETMR